MTTIDEAAVLKLLKTGAPFVAALRKMLVDLGVSKTEARRIIMECVRIDEERS